MRMNTINCIKLIIMNTHPKHQYKGKPAKVALEVIISIFVLIFVYAALTKLMEGDSFYNNLNNSPILHGGITPYLLSWGIPTLEIITAILLLIPRTRLKGLYASLGLMILFTLYVVGIVFFSPYTPCSCGGILTLLTWPQHLVLNIGLILMAILGIRLHRTTEDSKIKLSQYRGNRTGLPT